MIEEMFLKCPFCGRSWKEVVSDERNDEELIECPCGHRVKISESEDKFKKDIW